MHAYPKREVIGEILLRLRILLTGNDSRSRETVSKDPGHLRIRSVADCSKNRCVRREDFGFLQAFAMWVTVAPYFDNANHDFLVIPTRGQRRH